MAALEHMDYNLCYLTQMFKKVQFKPIESYIAQRIWHQLNRLDIQMICQQYVKRDNTYALIDIYFPQINYGVEIDEPYHADLVQKKKDKLREYEIIKQTNITLQHINCYEQHKSKKKEFFFRPIVQIHQQIDSAVAEIRKRIEQSEQNRTLLPWLSENTMTADYHKRKGVLRVQDNDSFRTTLDICETFGVSAVYRRGGRPLNNGYFLWWPKCGHKHWTTKLSPNGEIITEQHNIQTKNTGKATSIEQPKRITFYKQENAFGVSCYRFIGVFQFDTTNNNITTYKKISDEYPLK